MAGNILRKLSGGAAAASEASAARAASARAGITECFMLGASRGWCSHGTRPQRRAHAHLPETRQRAGASVSLVKLGRLPARLAAPEQRSRARRRVEASGAARHESRRVPLPDGSRQGLNSDWTGLRPSLPRGVACSAAPPPAMRGARPPGGASGRARVSLHHAARAAARGGASGAARAVVHTEGFYVRSLYMF